MRNAPKIRDPLQRMPTSALAVCIAVVLALIAAPTYAQGQHSGAAVISMVGCEPQQFYVPQRGGECWECPAGFIRSQAPVLSRAACTKPLVRNAEKHDRATGVMGTDCPVGQFWDPSGHCFSCPDGYQRSQAAVQSPRACKRGGAVLYAAARYVGRAS